MDDRTDDFLDRPDGDDESLGPDDEYQLLLTRLRAERFQVRMPTIAAPVQLLGYLPSGERFYLRCRSETCSLRVAPADGDPVSNPTWEDRLSQWDQYGASALSPAETEAVLRELLANYELGRHGGGAQNHSAV